MICILAMALSFCVINIILASVINNNIQLFVDIVIWIGLNLWFDKIRDRKKKKIYAKSTIDRG